MKNIPKVWEESRRENKRQRPILGLCSSRSQFFVLSADFDIIPEKLLKSLPSEPELFWQDLFLEYKDKYSEIGIVTKSSRGKVKIFFPFILPDGLIVENLSRYQKECILNHTLKEEDQWYDNSYAGMSVTYLSPSIIESLQTLRTLLPQFIVLSPNGCNDDSYKDVPNCLFVSRTVFEKYENTNTHTDTKYGIICKQTETLLEDQVNNSDHFSNTVSSKKFFKYEGGEVESYAFSSILLDKKGGEEFLRRIVLMVGLTKKEGFGLSVNKLARECGVSAPQISKLISLLIDAGFLKCINSHYILGVRPRRYIACRDLRKQIIILTEDKTSAGLPEFIPDKAWDKTLFFIANYLRDKDLFIDYTKDLEGIDRNDRSKKVERILERWGEVIK